MKHAVRFSIFVVLAILAWWKITTDYSGISQLQQAKNLQYAEIFMNEFEMTVMNEDGTPGYILNGSRLQRNTGSDETTIRQPVFEMLQEDNHWTIVADQAIANDKNETIQLKNNVVMQQQNVEPAVTLRTEYLLIHTKTQVAQTHTLVDLTRGKSRLRSNGMIYNNITSELELTSSVNGYYVPHD